MHSDSIVNKILRFGEEITGSKVTDRTVMVSSLSEDFGYRDNIFLEIFNDTTIGTTYDSTWVPRRQPAAVTIIARTSAAQMSLEMLQDKTLANIVDRRDACRRDADLRFKFFRTWILGSNKTKRWPTGNSRLRRQCEVHVGVGKPHDTMLQDRHRALRRLRNIPYQRTWTEGSQRTRYWQKDAERQDCRTHTRT